MPEYGTSKITTCSFNVLYGDKKCPNMGSLIFGLCRLSDRFFAKMSIFIESGSTYPHILSCDFPFKYLRLKC